MENEDLGFNDIFKSLSNESEVEQGGRKLPSIDLETFSKNMSGVEKIEPENESRDILALQAKKKFLLNKDNYSRLEKKANEDFTGRAGADITVSVLTKKDLVKFSYSNNSDSRLKMKEEVLSFLDKNVNDKKELVVVDSNYEFIQNYLLAFISNKNYKVTTNTFKKVSLLSVIRKKVLKEDNVTARNLIESFNDYVELIEHEDKAINPESDIFLELDTYIAQKSRKLYNNELKKFIAND